MEPLLTVIIVLAIATLATGLVLPLTTRRREGQALPEALEAQLSTELTTRQ